jgi:hypothetical protein
VRTLKRLLLPSAHATGGRRRLRAEAQPLMSKQRRTTILITRSALPRGFDSRELRVVLFSFFCLPDANRDFKPLCVFESSNSRC